MDLYENIIFFISLTYTPVISALYFYVLTEEWRFSKRVMCALTIGMLVIYLISNIVVYSIWGYGPLGKFFTSAINIPIAFAFGVLLPKERNGQTLFTVLSVGTFLLVGATLGEILLSNSLPGRFLTRLVVYALLYFLIYRYLQKPLRQMKIDIKNGWYLISLIPLSLFLMLLTLLLQGNLYDDPQNKLIALLLSLFVGGTYIALYRIFLTIRNQFQVKADYDLLHSQLSSMQKHTDSIQAANDQIRIFRHDMRHYMQIELSCLDNGDLDGARRVLASMAENLDIVYENHKVRIYTRNPVIDAVLSDYASRAELHGIDMSIQCSLDECRADPAELAVVIANALDNATNACCKLPETARRTISLRGEPLLDRYFLEVENTFDGNVRFDAKRTIPLSDEPGHGYGSQSIAAFANKHAALVDYQTERGIFILRILF